MISKAMSMLLLSSTDIIFNLGEEPAEPKMYIVVSGNLEYTDSYGEVAPAACLKTGSSKSSHNQFSMQKKVLKLV